MSNITHFVGTYGYPGLFIMMVLEYVILIVPGETTLTTAGALWRSGAYHFHFSTLVIVTGLGTFTGSMLAYAIGRMFGRPLLLRYGKYIFLTPARLERSDALFKKYTILALFISRYIAVIRDILPYIAGINRVKLRIFVPIMFITSFIWTATFLAAGGLIVQMWYVVRQHWQTDLVPAILLVLLVGAGYWYIHRRIDRRLKEAKQQMTE
ncbi:DedA family protein [Alicyclobacillus tolerans]|uniref:DedA family protein n=1 Tax=Alicyclobacillus tolerans TaxID=90970 RepID=UPI001F477873|nr:DedA family protein [Alicyclobacillus tolerans]MCF8564233.1 DedA family protein [Alicyclobacillus tolerans]